MRINIHAHGQRLTYLYVHLSDAVGAEDLKHTLLRILLQGLDDVGGYLPLRTRTLGNTTTLGQHLNNLSLNVHFS